ncbi:MAG: helix-turn-helix domain-containing protein [Actinomycetota bacterium]|nr:helix-turn-helix domain-containing protein [Actinomycetota bacterium]
MSRSQVYALVRTGELPAIKIGGRRQWRVERSQLEAYITRACKDCVERVTDVSAIDPLPDPRLRPLRDPACPSEGA